MKVTPDKILSKNLYHLQNIYANKTGLKTQWLSYIVKKINLPFTEATSKIGQPPPTNQYIDVKKQNNGEYL